MPDYDDEEDDEIEIIHESVRAPRVEVVVPSRRYSVPESDVSCAGSFTSDDSSSEPPTPSPRASRADVATWKQLSENINAKSPGEVAGSNAVATERLVALSDAPSAAGFFHSEGQQPPALSQPNSALEREVVPTATDSVYMGEDALEDVDLTESDVESAVESAIESADESADGFSDDLFDEDAENSQQGLSLPPSVIDDSDEEPEASNPGTKLLDDNSYTEGQGTCRVGEEEHARASAAESVPIESSTVHSPVFDSTHWASPSSNQRGLVQKPNNNLNDARAPSPSDAAMAKTSIAQLPPLDTPMPVQSPPSLVVPIPCGFPRHSTTETPYAPPTWSAWQGYTADLPSEYAPFVYSPFNSQFPYQEGPLGYRQPADVIIIDGTSERGEEVPTNYEPATLRPPYQPLNDKGSPYLSTAVTALDADQSVRVPATTSLRATRLSIDDIVEKNTKDASTEIDGQKLKRKAEEISADEDVLATTLALSSDQVVSDLDLAPQSSESTQLATLQTVTSPIIEAEVNDPTQRTEEIEQPARKRAKTGVAKYAAAVFAGVVAGGVGTMAALLALPTIQLT